MAGPVTLTVEAYPYTGATGLVVEERTGYGWVEVLDTATIGTFPNYTTTYDVTGTATNRFRYRWTVGTATSSWLSPTVAVPATDEQTALLTQAVIAKTVRILALGGAPLGTHGEMTEFGAMRVMPDHQITELLAGLIRVNWDVDLTSLVEVADVTNMEGYDTLPDADEAAVERAIDAACSWVASYLLGAVAIA